MDTAQTLTASNSLQLRLLLYRPDLKLVAVLLQHALVVVFPELLRGVLSRYSLQDLRAAGMFVYECCSGETGQYIYLL